MCDLRASGVMIRDDVVGMLVGVVVGNVCWRLRQYEWTQ